MENQTNDKTILLSMVMTVYRGANLLNDTFAEIIAWEKTLPLGTQIEIIAVDDGSDDDSYAVILANQKRYPGKIRTLRLSRNYGAVAASHAGLQVARGDCVANIPQDLQEPLEMFSRMFSAWQNDIKINIGIRLSRSESFLKKTLANLYHGLFRILVMPDYPNSGTCCWLVDRQIAEELRQQPEKTLEITMLLFTMGYSRKLHSYHRQAPKIKSNWTLRKNIKLAVDNFIGFSYLPVRIMSLVGGVTALGSFCFAAYVFIGKLFPSLYTISQPAGWATIVVLLTFTTGMLMLMLGVIGEYLWRILDCVRGNPPYRIDTIHDDTPYRNHAKENNNPDHEKNQSL